MDLIKYSQLIDKIANGLSNGSIKQFEVSNIVQSELGSFNIDNLAASSTNEDKKRLLEDQKISFENRELYRAFIELWKCMNEIKKRPEPFTIKFHSTKLLEHIQIIKNFKENQNYNKTLLDAIKWVNESNNDFEITSEHIKIVSLKYI